MQQGRRNRFLKSLGKMMPVVFGFWTFIMNYDAHCSFTFIMQQLHLIALNALALVVWLFLVFFAYASSLLCEFLLSASLLNLLQNSSWLLEQLLLSNKQLFNLILACLSFLRRCFTSILKLILHVAGFRKWALLSFHSKSAAAVDLNLLHTMFEHLMLLKF